MLSLVIRLALRCGPRRPAGKASSGENTKSFVRCHLHEKSAKFPRAALGSYTLARIKFSISKPAPGITTGLAIRRRRISRASLHALAWPCLCACALPRQVPPRVFPASKTTASLMHLSRSRSFPLCRFSFVSQRHHRLDPRSAARGKVARKQRRASQCESGADHGYRVGGSNAVENTRNKAHQAQNARQSDGNAQKHEGKPLAHHKPQDIARTRDKGHANADLIGALGHRACNYPVDSNDRHEQSHSSEKTQNLHKDALRSHCLGRQLTHVHHEANSLIFVHCPDSLLSRFSDTGWIFGCADCKTKNRRGNLRKGKIDSCYRLRSGIPAPGAGRSCSSPSGPAEWSRRALDAP